MIERIKKNIEFFRKKYSLNGYVAERAIITAPFGERHFHEVILRLKKSTAVSELARKDMMLVLVITDEKSNLNNIPDWIKVIQVDPVPDWPGHPAYQNRFFKWALNFLFPNIKESIYCDADLYIVGDEKMLLNIFKTAGRMGFLSTRHTFGGWPGEYERIMRFRRFLDFNKIQKQAAYFLQENIPVDIQVSQNNFIARRHNSDIEPLIMDVLCQIFNYSERDQLALVHALYRQGSPLIYAQSDFLLTEFTPRINPHTVCFVDSSDPSTRRYRKIKTRFRIRIGFVE
ncbi:MAG: hypothetical protein WCV56_03355 [Candidatus Omnitrophota bacterium]